MQLKILTFTVLACKIILASDNISFIESKGFTYSNIPNISKSIPFDFKHIPFNTDCCRPLDKDPLHFPNTNSLIQYINEEIGYGVFTIENIAEGSILFPFGGKLVYGYCNENEKVPCYIVSEPTEQDIKNEDIFMTDPNHVDDSFLIFPFHPSLQEEYYEGIICCELLINPSQFRNEAAYINFSPRFSNVTPKLCSFEHDEKIIVWPYFIATTNIKAGDQILWDYGLINNEGLAELSTLYNKNWLDLSPNRSICFFCKNNALKTCSKCKIARYCSQKCQKEDWAIHKKYCHKH